MTCPTGSALVIGAAGITVDLAGHTVQSASPFAAGDWIGIDNAGGHDGVIVKNGTVRYEAEFDLGPGRAIDFEDASDGLFQNLNTLGDIQIDGDRNRLSGVRASNYGGPAVKLEGDDNDLLQADVNSQATAVEATGARTRISDSFLGGYSAGARVSGEDAIVLRNDISGAPSTGLTVTGSGHRIVDNDLSAVWGWGLSIDGGTNVVARENRIDGGFDASAALLVEGSTGSVLNLNRVTGMSPDGILVDAASTGTLLRFNHVSGMRDDGIDVESAGTSLNSNTANENGDLGIEAVAGVTDLGGNMAARNGNPLQCQNVFCQ
jgi:hypothetical protein